MDFTEEYKFDKRLIMRNVEQGLLTEAERDAALAALPDLADKTDRISVSLASIQARVSTRGNAPRPDEIGE